MAAPATRPPRRRWLRWALIALALLVLLPAAGLAVLLARFDAEALKPRIVAAVEAATGRQLTLAGPVGLAFSLTPTIALEGVALANLPGGSRPEMVRVRRVEVELALLPLLSRRLELRRVVLRAPDILLETTAEGRPNWVFTPPAAEIPAAPVPEPAPGSTPGPGRRFDIALERVALTEGRITWRDGQTGRSRALAIPRLEAEPRDGAEGLRLDGALGVEGLAFALRGETGPPAGLLDPAAATPWPLSLVLEGEGAQLTAEGAITRPGRGWSAAVAARVAELSRFAPLLPDAPLPPLRDLALTARLDDGGAGPVVSDLRLTLGESDLNSLLPGLRLLRLAATLPRGDASLALEAEARAREVPLRLAGTLGAPALLLPGGAAQPWPVDLTLEAAGATATARGSVAEPRALTGVDLALAARVPEVAALAPLAGGWLPPVRDLVLETRLAERGPGFAAGAFLRGLRLASSAGDLAGDLTWVVGQRQGVTGQLASERLDLDALLPARAPPAPPAAGTPVPPRPAADRRVIPDLALPLEALRVTDSWLQWTLAELRAGGLAMREVRLALAIQDGKAWLDPLSATLPGGRLTLRGAADVTTEPPGVQLMAQGAGLDLAALLGAFGVAQRPSGRLDLQGDLRGQGRGLRAIAATAHGGLTLALADARLPRAMLPAQIAPGLALPGEALAIGSARADFVVEAGIARVQTLVVNTEYGRVTGEGRISLRDETLDLRLNTDLRLPIPAVPGGLRVRAPVPLTGTLGAPRLDLAEAQGEAAGAVAGEVIERSLPQELQKPVEQLLRGLINRGR